MLIQSDSIDIKFVSQYIPDVMNSLYNNEVSKSITLEVIRDAFRKKQMQGKEYLLNSIKKYCNLNQKILVVGGWLGFISFVLHKSGYNYVHEIDIDINVAGFSKYLNRNNYQFKHFTKNINSFNTDNYDVIINTSCEHIADNSWVNNIKTNTLLFLQSTDLQSNQHVNVVNNLAEMKDKYPCKIVEEVEINCGDWSRFLLIGFK